MENRILNAFITSVLIAIAAAYPILQFSEHVLGMKYYFWFIYCYAIALPEILLDIKFILFPEIVKKSPPLHIKTFWGEVLLITAIIGGVFLCQGNPFTILIGAIFLSPILLAWALIQLVFNMWE